MTSLCIRAALPILQEMRFNNIILGSLTSVFRYGGPAGWKCDTRAEIPTDVAVCAMK